MATLEFNPISAMGKQALEAFEVIMSSHNKSDILQAGQRLIEIATNGAQLNSSDRSKLHSELSYQISLGGLGAGNLDELRLNLLRRAFTTLDSSY